MAVSDQNDDGVDAQFRMAMRKFPATVTVVTANDGIRDHGMTVTAVTSVSMSPPSLMVCLNNRTLLHEMLLNQARFSVHVLNQEHTETSDAFSGVVPAEERFNTGDWVRDASGMMVLRSALSNIICRRTVALPYGTHTIFVGEVTDVRVDEITHPLLYAEAAYCVSHPA